MRLPVATLLLLLIISPLLNAAAAPVRIVAARTAFNASLIEQMISGFRMLHPDAEFDVAPMGSLQALEEARRGNADVVITYYPPEELRLLNDGVVSNRIEFMFGAYAIFGPPGDELGLLKEQNVRGALKKMADNKVAFIVSSPNGGTYQKTMDLWASAGIKPDWPWYEVTDTTPLGSLRLAAEQGAYTLADLGTYLLNREELSETLVPLYQGGYELRKPFSVMLINYAHSPREENPLATAFVEFIISDAGQQLVTHTNQEVFHAPIFFPSAHLDPGVIAKRTNAALRLTTQHLRIVSGLFIFMLVLLLILVYIANRARQYRKQQSYAEVAREVAEKASIEKSNFMSKMSHELRTPLNAVIGFSQLLQMDKALGKEQLNTVKEIQHAGQHLLELINDVLDIAKIGSGDFDLKMQTVDMLDILKECAALTAPLGIKHGVTLSLTCQCDEAIQVYADKKRLKQAILNLVTNAYNYNHEGGTVEVTCQKVSTGMARLLVKDTGKGISREHQLTIFQPFSRAHEEESPIEGTGIGLTITKQLVEMMGGTIGVESEPGKGSTFWIELAMINSELNKSIIPDSVPEDTDVPRSPVTEDDRKYTLLYIEDNFTNLRLVEEIIKKHPGYTLLTAIEPVQGLELARQAKPDLILLDLNLPVMSGFEVMIRLGESKETKGIPVIAITANAMEADIERSARAGFKGHISKPIDVKKFFNDIEKCLLA